MRRTVVLIVAVTLICVLAAVGIAASLLINIDSFRPQLARAMSAAAGRDVALGRISLSLLSGSAVVENLSIADDPAFARTPFVTAKAVRIGVAVLPLVMSKRLQVQSLRLQEPRVTLRRSAAGTWNFASLGAPSGDTSADATSSSALTLSIDRLTIDGGEVVIETPQTPRAGYVYKDFTVNVRNFSATTPFDFTIGAAAPGGGQVKLDGRAGPLSARGVGSTALEATLDATRLDLTRSGLIDPAGGLAGLVDAHVQVASNGARINASGTLRGDKLQLVRGATPASRRIDLAFASDYDMATQEGMVKRGDVRVGDATGRLLGRFSTRGATPAVHVTFAGHRMPVSDLEALLPAIGATLPRGAKFRSGVIDVDLTANGPIDRIVMAGPIAMSDATLAGFDLGSRMKPIAALSGLQGTGDTVIQTLALTLRVAPEGVRVSNLACVVTPLGRLEGSGTIAPSGALDFKMNAKFARTTGVVADLTRMASLGNPENGIPFKIGGTTTSPVFVPDIAGAAAGAIQNRAGSAVGNAVRSLFDKLKR